MRTDPTSLRKVRFYDCWDYGTRKFFQASLEQCGAKVQDYRIRFKDQTVEFTFTLRNCFYTFLALLKETPVWDLTTYAVIYTGSIN